MNLEHVDLRDHLFWGCFFSHAPFIEDVFPGFQRSTGNVFHPLCVGLGYLDVPDRKLGSMVIGSMGYFTYFQMEFLLGL